MYIIYIVNLRTCSILPGGTPDLCLVRHKVSPLYSQFNRKGITATGEAVDCYWAWHKICSRETANKDSDVELSWLTDKL